MQTLQNTEVVQTRHLKDGRIWRRRKDTITNKFITTYESVTFDNLIVIKKNGSRQRFDQFKLFATIYIAYIGGKDSDSGSCTLKSKHILNQVIDTILAKSVEHITSKEISKITLSLIKSSDYNTAMRYVSKYYQ